MSITAVDTVRAHERSAPDPVLLTVEEAARRLRVGRTTCFRLIRTGKLESLMVGGLRRVPADAPAAFVNRLRAEQRPS
ncbi:excisionase family DNA-binding protein [Streptomyces sp. NPDC049906]|uniref:excisionase family DNA-binding protein n=1 Tax=Streptomyces sp. NPDC049906 TaxID=3155656 RepID=UPI00344A4628